MATLTLLPQTGPSSAGTMESQAPFCGHVALRALEASDYKVTSVAKQKLMEVMIKLMAQLT